MRFTLPGLPNVFWEVSVMVAGPPQLNVIRPPVTLTVATALPKAASVQVPGPVPTTTSARDAEAQLYRLLAPRVRRYGQRHLRDDHAFLTKGGVFDDDTLEAYMGLKEEELTKFRMTTHPIEFDMYYAS